MTKTIQQSVRFRARPEELFDIFLDSKKHSAATGGKASVSRKAGGKFTAWNGQLRGRNLLVVPKRLIVQSWRATQWKTGDPDSILVLQFSKARGGAKIDLVHVNVPQHDHKGVTQGWPKYYWKPWKKYLAAKAKSR
ncbi:MAG TPA: SRPBCC domain-containing protein [Candidatus Acidoferrales bacterium]|nr:SRPBCC domain-containing protein [Candidatus Acidoferrales bacterium]